MIEPKRTIWQLAGGPAARSYVDVFLNNQIGLIGPGDPGPWGPDRDDLAFGGGFVRRFASEVEIGDVFLLRTGISSIHAVGLVAEKYQYLKQFDDVNGWDLQHVHRVRWGILPKEYDFGRPVFGANPSRFSRTKDPSVIDFAERFLASPPTQWQTTPISELQIGEPELADVPEWLRPILAEIQDLAPFYWDRQSFGDHPSEDELIAHFVVPYLRSLGWAPELIAVKWRNIDVAVFKSLPRIPNNCHLVIEAKRLGEGVEGSLEQAKGYIEAIGASCDAVVTDGIRYRMYSHQNDFAPLAYANLERLKKSATKLFEKMKKT